VYIVYHDQSGAHACVIAAAIHLDQLPIDQIPSKSEISRIPLFNKLEKHQIGRLIFHGTDKYGNSVYTIGRKRSSQLVTNALQTVFDMIDGNKNQILCVDTSQENNRFISLGGMCSCRLGLTPLGDSLAAYGATRTYSRIAEIVKKTKLKIVP